MNADVKKTILHEEHIRLGGNMTEFADYDMPVNYPDGIIAEHLYTRRQAGLFDISHMGRFIVTGPDRTAFLRDTLTNDCGALGPGESQYTFIPNKSGGAIDDAYLYRFFEDSFMLVVNAANAEKDRAYLTEQMRRFDANMEDVTEDIGMISVQGPVAQDILSSIAGGPLPVKPRRNSLGRIKLDGGDVWLARTGYTGEAVGYEMFTRRDDTAHVWNRLIEKGAKPAGLGARDTLRLEAALPLYGHELGADIDGNEIPIYALGMAKFAVSLAEARGDFIGRENLYRQFLASNRIRARDFDDLADLPRVIRPFRMIGKGVPRAGNRVFRDGTEAGYVTSGTVAPYYKIEGEGAGTVLTDETDKRRIGLSLVRPDLSPGDLIDIEIRDSRYEGVVVERHLRSDTPPYSRAVL
jgi:aminomethyltransferase